MSPTATVRPPEDRHIPHFGLAEAAHRFFDQPPHPSWFIRNATIGAKLRSGGRLKLRLKKLPGKWVVSEEAIREFIDALTADRTGEPAPASPKATAARERELAATERELDEIRI